jgi:hypothetical protein
MHDPSSKKPKRPRDLNQLAYQIVREATEEEGEYAAGAASAEPEKNPAAVALGRLGGKKGGPARAKKLSAEQRRRIAQKAAKARWKKN